VPVIAVDGNRNTGYTGRTTKYYNISISIDAVKILYYIFSVFGLLHCMSVTIEITFRHTRKYYISKRGDFWCLFIVASRKCNCQGIGNNSMNNLLQLFLCAPNIKTFLIPYVLYVHEVAVYTHRKTRSGIRWNLSYYLARQTCGISSKSNSIIM